MRMFDLGRRLLSSSKKIDLSIKKIINNRHILSATYYRKESFNLLYKHAHNKDYENKLNSHTEHLRKLYENAMHLNQDLDINTIVLHERFTIDGIITKLYKAYLRDEKILSWSINDPEITDSELNSFTSCLKEFNINFEKTSIYINNRFRCLDIKITLPDDGQIKIADVKYLDHKHNINIASLNKLFKDAFTYIEKEHSEINQKINKMEEIEIISIPNSYSPVAIKKVIEENKNNKHIKIYTTEEKLHVIKSFYADPAPTNGI